MKVQLKKVLALVLIFCLLLSAVPVWAANGEPAQSVEETSVVSQTEQSQTTTQEELATPDTSAEVTVVREEESLRGEFEKHFLMSDGTYQAVVYSYPVHELVNGVWVELPIPEQTARGDVSPGNAQQNIIDNYVWQNHGVQDNNSVRLYIGKRSGNECRAFIRFATMPTIPAGATITAATMKVNIVSGTSTAYNAKASQVTGSWESGTIQWSNMPTIGSVLEDNISHNNKTKYQFSCLTAVQHWYDGSTTGQNENYGIMLQYADSTIADYNSFYSADCTDSTMRPSMTISYQPLNSDIRLDVGNRVTLSVTGANGVVTWTSSNTSIATVNPYGLVTGIQVGKAIITAYIGGLEFKKFTVNVTIADGVYRIANTAGLDLATYGGIAENTSVKMRSYSDSGFEELCQLWKIAYLGNGYYSIRPMHKLDMGLHAGGTMGSSVDIVSIGTSDTLSNVAPLGRWGISPTADGSSYFINHVGTGSLGMTMDGLYPSVGMGVITDTSSDTQGFFKWVFQPITETIGGAILYDKNTQTVVTAPSRHMEIGEVKTLSNLSLAVNAYSNIVIAQNFYWESSNPQVASVDSSTGDISALSSGTTEISGRVHRAGTYHYVRFELCVGYPDVFDDLIDLGYITVSQLNESGDGFYLCMTPLSDILVKGGVYSIPEDEQMLEYRDVTYYYDDWYIYAVCDDTVSYGLVKMREIEDDYEYADNDDPGVTISFVGLDITALMDCLTSPTINNRYSLFVALGKVTGPELAHHDNILAEYFAETESRGAYIIAEKFVYLIADTAINNEISVPNKCKSIFSQLENVQDQLLSPLLDPNTMLALTILQIRYSRIPNALNAINAEAGYTLFNKGTWTVSVRDTNNLSLLEKQAILSCYSGNVTFNSFAAEVEYHADITLITDWLEPVYSRAVRADMATGEETESGITDDAYYNLSSTYVLNQIAAHGEC